MDARLHYHAPDTDAFVALMQRRSLAGLHFEPMAPLRVRDRYLDTAAGALLAAGWVLRLRSQNGQGRARLRSFDPADEGLSQDLPEAADTLPTGAVQAAAEALAQSEPLAQLLAFRQYRTPRAIYDGRRLVAVLSLDVLTDDAAAVPESWHEVEVRRAPTGTEADLRRLDDELRELGFEPVARTKFERAVIRLGREADGPVLLLPDEREALEAFRASKSALEQRRAEVVLRAAAGEPTRTISFKAELSPSRVRHWKHAFRHERMGIFDMDDPTPEGASPPDDTEAPSFRVSELVEPSDPPPEGDPAGAGFDFPPDAVLQEPEVEMHGILDAVLEESTRHPGTPVFKGDT